MMDTKEIPSVTPISSGETAEMASNESATSSEDHWEQQPIPILQLEAMSLQNNAGSLVSQGKEEAPKTISVDLGAKELGGWNRTNCRKALGEYLQKTNQEAEYKIEKVSGGRFSVSMSISIPETGDKLSAVAFGSSKNNAKTPCAMDMVQQLYRMKILEECEDTIPNNGVIESKKSKNGGWNEKNSQKALNAFLEKTGQPPAACRTERARKGNHFNSSLSIFIAQTGNKVTSTGNGRTTKASEDTCQMAMVRQLYRMGVLDAFQKNGIVFDLVKKTEITVTNRKKLIPENTDRSEEKCEEKSTLLIENGAVESKKTGNGGWNLENSKEALEDFLDRTLQSPALYNTEKMNAKKGKSKGCTSCLSLFIPETGEKVTAHGTGAKATTAEANCTMVMVRLLYRKGALEKYEGNANMGRGGWNKQNSMQGLDEYLQKTKQSPSVYQISEDKTKKGKVVFTATTSVFVPEIDQHVSGEGKETNKKNAERICAQMIVRQLYRMKVLGEFRRMENQKEAKAINKLPKIPVSIPDDLVTRVKNYVRLQGVTPVVPSSGKASLSAPQNLILSFHRNFARFPNSKISRPRAIPWSPPIPNWNPWMGCEIGKEPWASKTLPQMNRWIAKMEENKFVNDEIQRERKKLPVAKYRQQIIDTVAANQVTLIKGATGCGKSTQVVQYLLESFYEAGRGAEFNAIVSQPRRICAISLAERVAAERNEERVGQTVGYGVRFDSVSPCPYGSIFFCTVGLLMKKMEKGLLGVSHVIIDEIHERDINTDFVLIVLREMVKEFPDLRIILMSATVDTKMFTSYFGCCPVIEMHGRSHPVKRLFLDDIIKKLDYMPPELPKTQKKTNQWTGGEIDEKAKNLNILDKDADPKLREAMSRIDENEISYDLIEKILLDIVANGVVGAVLIFLPGWMEITTLLDQLSAHPTFSDASRFVLLPLHSQLPSGEQRKVFYHFGKGVRKIIISTNIAESSVTIDDVVYVIDSCKVREGNHIASHNMLHFDTVWTSRSNIMQRCGRAGRVRPGIAYELCSNARFEALDDHRTAEILRSPLTSIALTIKSLRLGSVVEFLKKAIEQPSTEAVEEAEKELKDMGALDGNLELTKLGKIIARLPVEPIVGKAIVLAASLGIGSLMCELAAASSFTSPFVPDRECRRLNSAQRSFAGNRYSDHAALIAVNQAFSEIAEEEEKDFCKRFSLNAPVLKSTADARNQLIGAMSRRGFPTEVLVPIRADLNGPDTNVDLLTSLLVAAYYPNVSFHKGKRTVLTLEQSHAVISRMSILTSTASDSVANFPSPLIIFSEKVKVGAISCRELSLVSAVQLILFGSRRVECVGQNLVRLDNMILLETDVDVAAALIALRPCVEKHLIKTCFDPKTLLEQSESDLELVAILRELSSPSLFAEAKRR